MKKQPTTKCSSIFSSARPLLPLVCLATLLQSSASAATYTVTNTGDNGPGTLRQAISDANGNPGADVINFSTNGVISLVSALPVITGPTAINGYTTPGAVQGAIGSRAITISVDAGNTNSVVNSNGRLNGFGLFRFGTGADGSSISGLAIYNTFTSYEAILVENGLSNIHIWGNYFGMNAAGVASAATALRAPAILLCDKTTSNTAPIANITIGTNGDGINDANEGNAIGNTTYTVENGMIQVGGNAGGGFARIPVSNLKIAGNYIGMAADGLTPAPAFSQNMDGIDFRDIDGTNIVVGSDGDQLSDALERNLVSGNKGHGIAIESANGIAIAGNLIGTDKTGMLSRPNGAGQNSSNYGGIMIGTHALMASPPPCQNIVIGFDDSKHSSDVAAVVRNVISGNYNEGIVVGTNGGYNPSSPHTNIRIAGNYIGTDITGNAALGNGVTPSTSYKFGTGINLTAATSVTIGTNTNGVADDVEGNVLSGAKNGWGIVMNKDIYKVNNCIVAGNKIGVGANGTTVIGDELGGLVLYAANNIRIGSNDDGANDAIEGNIIANNGFGSGGRNGIRISDTSFNVRISRNSFYNNKSLPIDLGVISVTPNDGLTTANQPNLLLDFPVLKGYAISDSTVTVAGYVSSCNGNDTTAGAAIAGAKTIQFYKQTDDGDQNGILGGSCSYAVAHGEGSQYLGSIAGVVNAFNTTFTLEPGATFTASDKLTAITIDASGNTSEFGGTISTPIPLNMHIRSFTATPEAGRVILRWTTAAEINNKGFHIERSADGTHWYEIGFTATRTTNGSSSFELSYDYTDADPLAGANYFRLKQQDLGGKTGLSETRLIMMQDGAGAIVVFPNPATDRLNIALPAHLLNQPAQFDLVDQLGQVVLSHATGAAARVEQIATGHLAPGAYILKIQQPGTVTYKKIQLVR